MKTTKALSTLLGSSVIALNLGLGIQASGSAFTITEIGSSGGNPGDLPVFEVSGLMAGDMFSLFWTSENSGLDFLDVEGKVTVDNLTNSTAEVTVKLTNNMEQVEGENGPRITAFGLSVEGLDTFSPVTGGMFLDLADNSNFAGFQDVNLCATSGNNCSGGGPGGIPQEDGMDTFTFSFTGDFSTDNGPKLTLNDFALKIQGGPGGESFEVPGEPDGGGPGPGEEIPEPGTVMGLALLAGTALLSRCRKSE